MMYASESCIVAEPLCGLRRQYQSSSATFIGLSLDTFITSVCLRHWNRTLKSASRESRETKPTSTAIDKLRHFHLNALSGTGELPAVLELDIAVSQPTLATRLGYGLVKRRRPNCMPKTRDVELPVGCGLWQSCWRVERRLALT